MSAKIDDQVSRLDGLKWGIVIALLILGVGANFYFAQQILAVRIVAWILLLAVIALLAAQTSKGRQALSFIREARIEIRKVVWPTRQETVQTTVIVVLMVIIMSLILWGVDALLLWLIGLLTG